MLKNSSPSGYAYTPTLASPTASSVADDELVAAQALRRSRVLRVVLATLLEPQDGGAGPIGRRRRAASPFRLRVVPPLGRPGCCPGAAGRCCRLGARAQHHVHQMLRHFHGMRYPAVTTCAALVCRGARRPGPHPGLLRVGGQLSREWSPLSVQPAKATKRPPLDTASSATDRCLAPSLGDSSLDTPEWSRSVLPIRMRSNASAERRPSTGASAGSSTTGSVLTRRIRHKSG